MPNEVFFDITVTEMYINEQSMVVNVYYSKKDSTDHFPFKKVRPFALGIKDV